MTLVIYTLLVIASATTVFSVCCNITSAAGKGDVVLAEGIHDISTSLETPGISAVFAVAIMSRTCGFPDHWLTAITCAGGLAAIGFVLYGVYLWYETKKMSGTPTDSWVAGKSISIIAVVTGCIAALCCAAVFYGHLR